jgi:hypothetical protein
MNNDDALTFSFANMYGFIAFQDQPGSPVTLARAFQSSRDPRLYTM